MKYNKTFLVKSKYIWILLAYFIILIFINYNFKIIPNKLLFLLLIFSISIIVLNFLKKYINLKNNPLLKNSGYSYDYQDIKNLFLTKIIPVAIFVYQILLIWIPVIFEKMSVKK